MINRKGNFSYTNSDGTIDTWKFDPEKSTSGAYEIEITYPKGYKHQNEIIVKEQSNLPITKRMFLNPSNGKMVSYQRARMLKLI